MSEDQGITQKKANSLQFTTLTSHCQVPPQLSALHHTLHKHTQVIPLGLHFLLEAPVSHKIYIK